MFCNSKDSGETGYRLFWLAYPAKCITRCKRYVCLGAVLVGLFYCSCGRRSYTILVSSSASSVALVMALSSYTPFSHLYGYGDGEPSEFFIYPFLFPDLFHDSYGVLG